MPARINDGLTNVQRYQRRHPDRVKAAQARYRARNPEKEKARGRLSTRLRNGVVGATDETRSGPCPICLKHADVLMCDHDRATGHIRGWLCRKCNAGLGLFGDTLDGVRRAARYLEHDV